MARFAGTDARGPIDVSVYGRDAVDAQFFSKCFRFFVYRDSGPMLTLTRIQQVEREAYHKLMAGRTGAARARRRGGRTDRPRQGRGARVPTPARKASG